MAPTKENNSLATHPTPVTTPYDNAVAERINGILKDEFAFGGIFENLEQAKELIEKVAVIYNEKRPHISNHYLTPNEMHQQDKLKIKTWKKDR